MPDRRRSRAIGGRARLAGRPAAVARRGWRRGRRPPAVAGVRGAGSAACSGSSSWSSPGSLVAGERLRPVAASGRCPGSSPGRWSWRSLVAMGRALPGDRPDARRAGRGDPARRGRRLHGPGRPGRAAAAGPPASSARGFDTMAARLETDERQRRTLLADVSHELRTPLAVVQGNLEAILDGVYPADPAHLALDPRRDAGARPAHRRPADARPVGGRHAGPPSRADRPGHPRRRRRALVRASRRDRRRDADGRHRRRPADRRHRPGPDPRGPGQPRRERPPAHAGRRAGRGGRGDRPTTARGSASRSATRAPASSRRSSRTSSIGS